jgi:uncharacterized protein (TIGR00369 family)
MSEKEFKIQTERARKALERLPLAETLGMELVDLGPGTASLSLVINDLLRQPGGLLHGGVTATLIDTSMAFAVRTVIDPTEPTATVDLTIHYVRPHTEGRATAISRVLRTGKRIVSVSSDVVNEEGALLATALSTYIRL